MIKIFTMEFVEINCGGCGVIYYIPQILHKELLRTHKGFNCPNGCSRQFSAKSEEEKLRDELTSLKAKQDQLNAELSVRERKLKRVANGVCPCCNRSFTNLRKHIKTKHKDFIKDV